MSEAKTKQRGTALSPQDFLLLDQWGQRLDEAFGETPYFVGSAARAEQYRDVDVRMLLPEWLHDNASFVRLSLRLRTLNMAVTLWGRQVTGLPIDFQFQPHEEFHSYDGDRRSALGIAIRHATDANDPARIERSE